MSVSFLTVEQTELSPGFALPGASPANALCPTLLIRDSSSSIMDVSAGSSSRPSGCQLMVTSMSSPSLSRDSPTIPVLTATCTKLIARPVHSANSKVPLMILQSYKHRSPAAAACNYVPYQPSTSAPVAPLPFFTPLKLTTWVRANPGVAPGGD
jgi:hypothetical protein